MHRWPTTVSTLGASVLMGAHAPTSLAPQTEPNSVWSALKAEAVKL